MSQETSSYCLATNNGEWSLLSNTNCANKAMFLERTKSEIYYELAQNIVQEIVLTTKEQLDSAPSSKDLIKSVLKFPRKLRRTYSKEVKQLSETTVRSCLLT